MSKKTRRISPVFLIGYFMMAGLLQYSSAGEAVSFKKARPVWLKDRAAEMNTSAGFRAVFTLTKENPVVLRCTGQTCYRIG